MAVGITFNETMAGAFALGVSDPEVRADKGRKDRTELAVHANVTIPDLDAFIVDSAHAGELKGTIEFPPFGNEATAKSGMFNLFSPSGKGGLKYMVYELAFAVDGEPRYLAGKKHVHDDPGMDLWSDTTTLFTTLHDGEGVSAPVIGAGILRLDMGDFLKLMSTIRVSGAKTAAERAATVTKFGTFFMGELWDIYGPEF